MHQHNDQSINTYYVFRFQFPHPYQYELDHWTPVPSQLDKGAVTVSNTSQLDISMSMNLLSVYNFGDTSNKIGKSLLLFKTVILEKHQYLDILCLCREY
jgi:hypothetical protein